MDIDLDIYNLEELMSLSDRINESIRRKKSHIYSNEYIEELESLSEKLVKYILENITYINDESLKIEYGFDRLNIFFEAWSHTSIYLVCDYQNMWYLSGLKSYAINGRRQYEIHRRGNDLILSSGKHSSEKDKVLPIKFCSNIQELEEYIKELLVDHF